ncbi:MAG: methyltransferase [Variovorax sp.]|nr:methyltransferase [Variovorax sp.]
MSRCTTFAALPRNMLSVHRFVDTSPKAILAMQSPPSLLSRVLLCLVIAIGLTACASPTQRFAKIVASPDRSAADRTNDLRRHPGEMLSFIDPQPGWTALDVSTGGGYTTELLARAVGPSGRVYAQMQPRDPGRPVPLPAAAEGGGMASPPSAAPRVQRTTVEVLADRTQSMAAGGVSAAPIVYVGQRFDDPVPPEVADGRLDLVTLMFNYHDFGFMGVDREKMNRALFRALKRGGVFVVADHAGRPNTGISESGTLHRVEESFLRREVEAAGFRLADEGNFLRNPADPRDRNTPEPPQPKDEFVLKFIKP